MQFFHRANLLAQRCRLPQRVEFLGELLFSIYGCQAVRRAMSAHYPFGRQAQSADVQ